MDQGTSVADNPVSPTPAKLCGCGCGKPTPIAKKTRAERGDVKGQPVRFIRGHRPGVKPRAAQIPRPRPKEVPQGTKSCECGCGNPAPTAQATNPKIGHVKGQPTRFVRGHQPKRQGPQEWNRKFFVEPGQRFGRSIVTSPDFLLQELGGGSRTRAVRLRCECGTEYIRRVKYLFGRPDPDGEYCGKCLAGADFTGQRFGMLTVIRWTWVEIPSGPGEREGCGGRWICKCACGNEVPVSPWALRDGKARSCGCSRTKPRPGNSLGDAAMRQLMTTYRTHARMRGLPWDLSQDDFRRLTSMDCHYCGTAPSQLVKKGPASGDYVYNGIDRVDNALGYSLNIDNLGLSNVVPCCGPCNRAKGTMSYGEFLAWISRLASFHFFRPDVMPPGLLKPTA